MGGIYVVRRADLLIVMFGHVYAFTCISLGISSLQNCLVAGCMRCDLSVVIFISYMVHWSWYDEVWRPCLGICVQQ